MFKKFETKLAAMFLSVILLFPVAELSAQKSVQANQAKFGRLLRLVDGYYVDSTNIDELTEKAIIHLLSELMDTNRNQEYRIRIIRQIEEFQPEYERMWDRVLAVLCNRNES